MSKVKLIKIETRAVDSRRTPNTKYKAYVGLRHIGFIESQYNRTDTGKHNDQETATKAWLYWREDDRGPYSWKSPGETWSREEASSELAALDEDLELKARPWSLVSVDGDKKWHAALKGWADTFCGSTVAGTLPGNGSPTCVLCWDVTDDMRG